MPGQLTIDGQGGHFPCFWLDDSGGKPWSDLAGYNFNPMPTAPSGWQATTSGSYALSDKLKVNAGQQVNVAVILATAHIKPYWDFGFALLVQGFSVIDVLFVLRPDGINQYGDMGPNVFFAAPSAGVTVEQVTKDATGILLNGVDYGSVANAGCGNISTYVSAKVKPAAGDYQILVGIFGPSSPPLPSRPAAMVVPFFNVTQG